MGGLILVTAQDQKHIQPLHVEQHHHFLKSVKHVTEKKVVYCRLLTLFLETHVEELQSS